MANKSDSESIAHNRAEIFIKKKKNKTYKINKQKIIKKYNQRERVNNSRASLTSPFPPPPLFLSYPHLMALARDPVANVRLEAGRVVAMLETRSRTSAEVTKVGRWVYAAL